ncbi:hypothetical protein ASF84_24205 [Pseudomonas sp. Leaf127]|nr:hypothetical protein ASF84_24205 [Pseudomonas sp. Leaf127]
MERLRLFRRWHWDASWWWAPDRKREPSISGQLSAWNVGFMERTRLSRSGYLRAVALNYPIRSVVDLAAVADLAKINGDLGRVAGLLKLWLVEKYDQGTRAVDIDAIMVEFRELQGEVRAIMSKVVHERK